jgi:hypothetical protein
VSVCDLCIGRRVLYRGMNAEILDIHCWQAKTPLVQIRVYGRYTHWTTADQLELR